MKASTVQKLVEKYLVNGDHAKIHNGSWMPLTIEKIGQGPNGHQAVSICHYGEQEGDLMRDPEICFEVVGNEVFPYYFRNDYAGLEQVVYVSDENGKVTHVRPRLKKEIESFLRIWNRNLKEQGFLKA